MEAGKLSRVAALFAAALVLQGCGGGGGGGGSAPAPAPVAGPPVVTERNTGLQSPWGMAFLPDGRLIVTEKGGTMQLLAANGASLGGIAGLPSDVVTAGQAGLMDVALSPSFASNHQIFFTFSERDPTNSMRSGTAVARGVFDPDARVITQLAIIYRQLPKVISNANYGSRLVFDAAGDLFVTLGDRELPSERGNAQDPSKGHGKVVHIRTDGSAAPGNPGWTQPDALPQVWSIGHRNPQGAAIHPSTGELWISEHGPQGGDEINRVLPGRNYGWPLTSYGQEYGTLNFVGPTSWPGTEQPAWVWQMADGSPWTVGTMSSTAPAGMAFYTSTLMPQWQGNLFVTALAGTSLWRLTLQGNTVTGQERLLASRGERMRDVEQGPDGALYILTDNGKLLRYGP